MTQSQSSDSTWTTTLQQQRDFAEGAADARSGNGGRS
jgi:hypothetical protein